MIYFDASLKKPKNIWFRGGSLEREHFENLRQMFSEIESSTRGRNGESYTICIDRVALMDRNGTQCSDTVVVHYNTERVEWQDVLSDPRNLFIISEYFAGSMVESPSSVALISAVKHFFKTGSSYWSPPESGINDKLWDDRLLQKLALGRKAHIIYFGSPTIHGNDLRVLVTEKQKRQVLLNPSRAKALSDCAIEYYQVSNESAHFDDVLDSWLVTEARRDASWDGIHYHFHNGDQFKGDVSQMLLNMLLNSYCATDPNKTPCDQQKVQTGSSSLKKAVLQIDLRGPRWGPDRDMPSHASSTCMYKGRVARNVSKSFRYQGLEFWNRLSDADSASNDVR